MPSIRVDKYLSNAGIASRRALKKWLKENQVELNGVRVIDVGSRIDPERDTLLINGERVNRQSEFVYIALNKPINVVSTTSDEFGRVTVTDLVDLVMRVYPVGRLDTDSIGLILLTSDGELTHKLTHPKFHIGKRYEVTVIGKVKPWQIKDLSNGLELKDGLTAPAEVKILKEDKEKNTTTIEFIIHEGRNRQLRRMCGAVGLEVIELKRVAIGPIELGDLKSGDWRYLTMEEVDQLKNLFNLDVKRDTKF